ncbi:hypothetical protein ONZ51_g11217 [Trametes cubensis]|uniref:Uncharacterized protein n=1 Tax=Trametes cubensis TaxID=1111947 RepID=A0AAD7X824_9APHY|nr:hypothetical protein ONZ51_g11217 [Trametes cubensis]
MASVSASDIYVGTPAGKESSSDAVVESELQYPEYGDLDTEDPEAERQIIRRRPRENTDKLRGAVPATDSKPSSARIREKLRKSTLSNAVKGATRYDGGGRTRRRPSNPKARRSVRKAEGAPN